MSIETHVEENRLKDIRIGIEKMNIEYVKYLKSQLFLNICEDLTSSETESDTLHDKVNSNLVIFDIDNKLEQIPDSNENFLNLLDIDPEVITENKLTESEESTLKSVIQNDLGKICTKFEKKLSKLDNDGLLLCPNHVTGPDTLLNSSKLSILKCHTDFVRNIEEYSNLIISTKNLLDELINCHFSVSNHFLNDFNSSDKKAKLLDLKAKIFCYKIVANILSKDNKTYDSLLLLRDRLKKKETNTSIELTRCDLLLNNYKALDGTEFTKILNRYKHVNKQIEHYKWTLAQLRE